MNSVSDQDQTIEQILRRDACMTLPDAPWSTIVCTVDVYILRGQYCAYPCFSSWSPNVQKPRESPARISCLQHRAQRRLNGGCRWEEKSELTLMVMATSIIAKWLYTPWASSPHLLVHEFCCFWTLAFKTFSSPENEVEVPPECSQTAVSLQSVCSLRGGGRHDDSTTVTSFLKWPGCMIFCEDDVCDSARFKIIYRVYLEHIVEYSTLTLIAQW